MEARSKLIRILLVAAGILAMALGLLAVIFGSSSFMRIVSAITAISVAVAFWCLAAAASRMGQRR